MFGMTRGCERCDHQMRYGPGRTTKGHSAICRKRILVELAKTAEGQRRISNATVRLDKTVAELGEPHRADVAQGENVQDGNGQHREDAASTPAVEVPQNLFLYHHVSPGRYPLLLMKTGLSKLTLHPEGLRFSRARQEDTTTAMTMAEMTMCRKLQAWRSTR